MVFDLIGKGLSGGEGTVYKIGTVPGLSGNFCAKIYHKEFLAKHKDEKYAKLSYMVGHRPNTLSDNSGMIQICFPAFLLFDSSVGGNFIGYVMYLALDNSTDLQDVAMNISKARFESLRRNGKTDKIGEEIFYKFPRPHKSSEINYLINRYKIIHNISSLINYLHQEDRYVIGDIKPENILMTTRAGISLVDVDSIQITENKKLLFPNETSTPEYCPPEFLHNPKQIKTVSFDLFSMAVLFYQILIGTHPYTYTIPSQQKQNDITGNIMTGFYANGKKKSSFNRPPCHLLFASLPKSIQELFDRAFEGKPEKRPTALEWKQVMYDIISKGPQMPVVSPKPFGQPPVVSPKPAGQTPTNPPSTSVPSLPAKCPCGTTYYRSYSRYCHRCGRPR